MSIYRGGFVVMSALLVLVTAACGGAAGALPGGTSGNRPVPVVNSAPVFVSAPLAAAQESVAYTYQAQASDADGDVLTFDLVTAPAGMSGTAAGLVTWTPAAGQAGDHPVTLVVSDGTVAVSQDWAITVTAVPAAGVAPLITSVAPDTATVGVPYTYQIVATGTPAPTVSVSIHPAWLAFDALTNTLSGTPTLSDAGTTPLIGVEAVNGVMPNAAELVTITVSASVAPFITSIAPNTAYVGTPYTYQVTVTGAPLPTVTVRGHPLWLQFDASTNRLAGTPDAGDVGPTGAITVEAANGTLPNHEVQFTITVVSTPAPQPVISTSSLAGVSEGAPGQTTSIDFEIRLSSPAAQDVTVDVATRDGGSGQATLADNDYQAKAEPVTFRPGEISQIFSVIINGDAAAEPDELFIIELSNPSANAALSSSPRAHGTILNDDFVVNISAPTARYEGVAGSSDEVHFHVSLNAPAVQPVIVTVETVDGSASAAGGDYDALINNYTVAISAGQQSRSLPVAIHGDDLIEADETFSVRIVSVLGASVSSTASSATYTILNDDFSTLPVLSIDPLPPPRYENDTGHWQNMSCTVTLSAPSQTEVTVELETADGTASESEGDYLPAPPILRFAPYTTTQTFSPSTVGDNVYEYGDETFTVTMRNPVGAVLGAQTTATFTILEDELFVPPVFSIINSSEIIEGAAGSTATLVFTVSLSTELREPVEVDIATVDSSATVAGGDYASASTRLRFNARELIKSFPVTIYGDDVAEADERFTVVLSNPSVLTNPAGGLTVIGTGTAEGRILNDDGAQTQPGLPMVSIAAPAAPVIENGNPVGAAEAVFMVTLSAASADAIFVDVTTRNGTADAIEDYQAKSETLRFNPGETSQPFAVAIVGDITVEAFETFTATLSNPANAALGSTVAAEAVIANDDTTITISPPSVLEGPSGTTTTMSFVGRLAAASALVVSCDLLSVIENSATVADGDFVAPAARTLRFAPGELEQSFGFTINGDDKVEWHETFNVSVGNVINASLIGTGVVTGTILNDEAAFSISRPWAGEGAASTTTTLTFGVTLTGPLSQSVSVDVATSDGTAMAADNDYVPAARTLTFAPNETSKTFEVTINGDGTPEASESFDVILSNATGGPFGGGGNVGSAVGNIVNDDGVTAGSGTVIVWGGQTASSTYSKNGAIYDLTAKTWRTTPGLASWDQVPLSPRMQHTAVWTGTQMIVWGGEEKVGSTKRRVADGAAYDPVSDAWTVSPGLEIGAPSGRPSARRGHVAVWTGTSMIVWGGWTLNGYVADGAIYDPAGGTWTAPAELSSGPLLPRRNAAAVWTGTKLLIWGGHSYNAATNTYEYAADGALYDPVARTWEQPANLSSHANRPDGRENAAACWDGFDLLVWGGSIGGARLNNGGRYSSNAWTLTTGLTATVSPLLGRDYAKGVWTGSAMLVWGGASTTSADGPFASNGAFYDPAADTWFVLPGLNDDANRPAGRYGHTMVWTGP